MSKLIAALLTVFVLGTVSGAFIGARFQEERREKLEKVENLDENIFEFLKSELALDADQARTIEPMVAAACAEVRGVYDRGAWEIEQIILKHHDLIARKLTPEQDKIFKKMEAERQLENQQREGIVP